ncbi:LuxR C-terminal-related transcriptional regulator [Mycolicibacterium litorale]|uniref:LuxR C-terminal-related transcriptional regulator n=1 Tax=Mycolicibacterium litorale TaxID=758802 RepID=UPI003CF7D016
MRLVWPLTGRLEELSAIRQGLSSDSAGIVVHGMAGVGKSRIAREALLEAERAGFETRWVVGTSTARPVPLGALAAWAQAANGNSLHRVRAVMEALVSGASGRTTLIGVDDVHLIDDLSAFVLHQIVHLDAAKLVVTVRDGDAVPPGIQELLNDVRLERMDLQPLSRDDTTHLVAAALGQPLDPDGAERLWKLTRGNALYVRNIVEQEVRDGRLARRDRCWQWTGDPVIPPGLVEMVEARIGSVPAAVGEVLDILAVAGPIDLASLCRITDPSAVEDAETRGLVVLDATDGGQFEVQVAHPLYSEVRRNRSASTRLRRLRGLAASELARSGRRRDLQTIIRYATLILESDRAADADLVMQATRAASALPDLSLAERLAAAAVSAGGGFEARFLRALALSWLGRGAEADAVLSEIPPPGMSGREAGRVAFLRGMNRLYALADPEGAAAEAVAATSSAAPDTSDCIDAFMGVYWAATGRPRTATTAWQGLDLDGLPEVVRASTAWGLAVVSGDAGRTASAEAAASLGYGAVTASEGALMRFVITDAHVGMLLQAGRPREAAAIATQLHEQFRHVPDVARALGAAIAGRAALGEGRLETACRLLQPAVEAWWADGDPIGFGYRYQLPWAVALALRGSVEPAVTALQKRRHPGWGFVEYEWLLAKAWVAAAQGAVSDANRTALSAAEAARSCGQFAAEVVCLQTAVQLGCRSAAPRLRELSSVVEGLRVGLASRYADALSEGNGSGLMGVSEDFERMGDRIAAMDSAAHAAVAHRHNGLRGSAFIAAARAEELAAECGGASTPALRLAAQRLPLTGREHEIVMLVGQGLSSNGVATRLSLSVRTVEGHIYRAMAKTGAGSRGELVAMLRSGKADLVG